MFKPLRSQPQTDSVLCMLPWRRACFNKFALTNWMNCRSRGTIMLEIMITSFISLIAFLYTTLWCAWELIWQMPEPGAVHTYTFPPAGGDVAQWHTRTRNCRTVGANFTFHIQTTVLLCSGANCQGTENHTTHDNRDELMLHVQQETEKVAVYKKRSFIWQETLVIPAGKSFIKSTYIYLQCQPCMMCLIRNKTKA